MSYKTDKQYSVPFYPQAFFGDKRVERMSALAQAFYMVLLMKMWIYDEHQCRIRDDDNEISRLLKIRKSQWLKIRAEIQWEGDCIFIKQDGYLYSKRLKQEKDRRTEYCVTQSKNALSRYKK